MAFSLALLAACGGAILLTGVRIARRADELADRLHVGEAIFGAVLLGASTSLSGTVTSVVAASAGDARLAFGNAVGGISVQTAFLAVADLTYRRSNLEHAAASMTNLVSCGLLLVLLLLHLTAALSPDVSVLSVNPVSLVVPVVYGYGLHLARAAHDQPMWRPRETDDTRHDVPDEASGGGLSTRSLVLRFAGGVAVMGAAGYGIALAGMDIARRTGISSTAVGALLTGVTTSLPELVTTLAAVRRGALTLAVGGIVGGNAFDTLFLPLSDVFYRRSSIYHALDPGDLVQLAVPALMAAVLLLGLLQRQTRGVGNIGFESLTILVLYAVAVVLLV